MKGDHCKNLQELTRAVADNAIYPDGKMLDKRKAFAEYVAAFHNDAEIPLRVDFEGIVLCRPTSQISFRTVASCERQCSFTRWPSNCEKSSAVPSPSSFVLRTKTSLKNGGSERHSSRVSEVETVRSACIYRLLKLTTIRSMRAVPKPDNNEVEKIKSEIQRWTIESRDSIMKHCKHLGLHAPDIDLSTHDVFEVIDRASERSTNAADFNAFFFAYLIQECGYETAFARFSQCQQVFKDEIAFMLEHFDQYAKLMVESQENPAAKTPTPIWYHCPCNGKADVEVVRSPDQKLVATCRACNTTVEFTGGIRPALEQMLPNVSLRAESMLIAFSGIGITFYVGGKAAPNTSAERTG